jgi:hypothetical protein
MVVHVFVRPVLETSTCAFVSNTLPSLASLVARIKLLRLQLRLPQVLLQTANATANFLRLNDDIDHDNINFIDFIYGDYITNDIINHDYSALTLGYIDNGNPHPRLMLQSDRPLHYRSDCGGVLEYIMTIYL